MFAMVTSPTQRPSRKASRSNSRISRAASSDTIVDVAVKDKDLSTLVAALKAGPGPHRFDDAVTLDIVQGDARETLPAHDGLADAWFLDGFAPARNPELWGEALMREVAAHTAPGGTLASYTAAGHVRRALAEAGLDVRRAPGYGRKRHMTLAGKPD